MKTTGNTPHSCRGVATPQAAILISVLSFFAFVSIKLTSFDFQTTKQYALVGLILAGESTGTAQTCLTYVLELDLVDTWEEYEELLYQDCNLEWIYDPGPQDQARFDEDNDHHRDDDEYDQIPEVGENTDINEEIDHGFNTTW